MLTTAQSTSLAAARAAVIDATDERDKVRAANDFRALVVAVADQVGCDECVVLLAERDRIDLNDEDCARLIDLLEDSARNPNV